NSRTLDIQRFQENEVILSFYQFEIAQTHILKVFCHSGGRIKSPNPKRPSVYGFEQFQTDRNSK
ncbi:MAG: hypothetical protein AAGG51_09605, partial [Cyanobacteria bacterium P01_G01_bin.54]